MPSSAAACHTRCPWPGEPAAASSSSAWVSVGSSRTRRRKDLSSLWPTGRSSGRGARPPSWSAVSSRAASTTARGFPPVSVTMRSATGGSIGWLIDLSSSSRAASSGRPAMCRVGRACSRPSAPAVSRTAKSSPTRSARSRRATKLRRSADSSSSHCASSTTHRTGRVSAASDSSVSTPRPTRNGSAGGPDTRPKATPRARRCGSGRSSTAGRNGTRIWWIAAKPRFFSDSAATIRTTCMSWACSITSSSRADLPTPGSPRSTRGLLIPRRTLSSTALSACLSAPRSTNRTPATIVLATATRSGPRGPTSGAPCTGPCRTAAGIRDSSEQAPSLASGHGLPRTARPPEPGAAAASHAARPPPSGHLRPAGVRRRRRRGVT